MKAAALYLVAIVAANLSVLIFGPASMPFNAFLLIGLDLTLRDSLHDAWGKDRLALKMGALIALGGLITFAINAGAGRIALASCVAFAVAALGDTVAYHYLRDRKWIVRANGSNVVGAALDSLLFPTLAFGVLMPWPILGQFVAKVMGGGLWSLVLRRWRVPAAAALLLLMAAPATGQTLLLSAHYDVQRQTPIASAVYTQPLPAKMFAAGFVEMWTTTSKAYPSRKAVLFSKHWITRPITRRLSASVEVAVMRNRPGVDFLWPQEMTFQQKKVYVAPKVGLSWRVR